MKDLENEEKNLHKVIPDDFDLGLDIDDYRTCETSLETDARRILE